MEHGQNLYAGKNRFMAGRDPILPARLRAKSPSGLRRSRPAMEYALRFLVRCFAAHEHSKSGFTPSAGIASLHCPFRLTRHPSYFAKEISDTKGTCSTRRPKVSPHPRSTPSLTPVRSDKRWPSKPTYCLSRTTFWTTSQSTKTATEVETSAEMLIPPMVPHLVPPLTPDKHLKAQEQDHEHHHQSGRGRKRFVAGSDPTLGASITPKSVRASGVAPGHSVCGLQANFPPIPRPECRKCLPEQIDGAHMHDPESNRGERPMPLLKPPEPVIAQRRYYLCIEEPLALTMERYAEFLGPDNLDQVVSQALQFTFKRDTQFKSWLKQHPEPTSKPSPSKATSKRTAPEGGAL